jgi:hypothetical protein
LELDCSLSLRSEHENGQNGELPHIDVEGVEQFRSTVEKDPRQTTHRKQTQQRRNQRTSEA